MSESILPTNSPLRGLFGSERFSKDERLMMHSALIGGSVYKRPQRPFKNDSFATRGFPTLFTSCCILTISVYSRLSLSSISARVQIESKPHKSETFLWLRHRDQDRQNVVIIYQKATQCLHIFKVDIALSTWTCGEQILFSSIC